jgi:hypothetical protein
MFGGLKAIRGLESHPRAFDAIRCYSLLSSLL